MSADHGQPSCHVCDRALDGEPWTLARDAEYGSTNDTFAYRLCADCDALSIHPLPVERLSEIYPPTYYSFAATEDNRIASENLVTRVKSQLDHRRFRRILGLVERPDPRILDVGGGTGSVSASFVAASEGRARATVVDIDPDSAEAARAKGLDYEISRFEEFTTSERYDVVLMLNVLEHVANPLEMLEKARDLLAPGGVLWLQTPNWRSLDARIFRRSYWAGLHTPRHWVIFSADGLTQAIRRAGLDPVAVERTQGAPFWTASILGRRRRNDEWDQLPKPLVEYRSFLPIAALTAGFDFATRPFRQTSQVVVLARHAKR